MTEITLGGNSRPPRSTGPAALMTALATATARIVTHSVVMAALVVTETFGEDGRLVFDERAIGVAVAGVALALRVPVLGAVALAAVTTALVRALFG